MPRDLGRVNDLLSAVNQWPWLGYKEQEIGARMWNQGSQHHRRRCAGRHASAIANLATVLFVVMLVPGCGGPVEHEKPLPTAAQLNSNIQDRLRAQDYDAALVIAGTLTKRYPNSPEAVAIQERLPDIKAGASAHAKVVAEQRAAAARGEVFHQIDVVSNALKALNANAIPETGWAGADVLVDTFNKGAELLEQVGRLAPLSREERVRVRDFKGLMVKRQTEVFPMIRMVSAKQFDTKLWEANVDVAAIGSRASTIEFVGAMFASNKNIADTQRLFDPMMKRLRFRRAQYRWYAGADEYQYFDLGGPKDADIARITAAGQSDRIDTSYIDKT